MTHEIDDIDRTVLRLLMRNARTPYLEIARECGISGAAIHQRVNKLAEKGLVQSTKLIVDPKILGFDVCAFIAIQLSDVSLHSSTVETLRKVPEVVECHFVTGRHNLLVKVYCRDNEHLMHTVFDHVLTLPGVTSTETSISLNEIISRQVSIEDVL